MLTKNLNLNKLRFFYEIVNQKSLNDVTATSGRTKSTLSRDIAYLEDYFGVDLFVRKNMNGHIRASVLTKEGEKLFYFCQKTFLDLEHLCKIIQNESSELSGTLTIITTAGISRFLLEECIKEFITRFPYIALRVLDHKWEFNFERDNIDVYIGSESLTYLDLIQDPIYDVSFNLFAHKDITIKNFFDLQNHQIIYNSRFELDSMKKFLEIEMDPKNLIQINSTDIIVSLIEQGFGIAILPSNVGIQLSQNVKPIFQDKISFSDKIYYSFLKKNQNYAIYTVLRDIFLEKQKNGQLFLK